MEKVIQEAFEEAIKEEYGVLLDNLISRTAEIPDDESAMLHFRVGYGLARKARDLALKALKGET